MNTTRWVIAVFLLGGAPGVQVIAGEAEDGSRSFVIPSVVAAQHTSQRMSAVLMQMSGARLVSEKVLRERISAPPAWVASVEEIGREVYYLLPSAVIPDQSRYAVFLRSDGEVVVLKQSGMDGTYEWYRALKAPDPSVRRNASPPVAATIAPGQS